MSVTLPVTTDNPIVSRYWNQVLSLLGVALFADGQPSQAKLGTFLDVAIELKFVIDPTVKIRRQNLRAWYEMHQVRLNEIDVFEIDDFLQSLLQDISIYGHKVDILTSMVQIVIADGDYSDAAQTLTKKTVLQWYMPAKHIDDIIYVCADLMKSPPLISKAETVH